MSTSLNQHLSKPQDSFQDEDFSSLDDGSSSNESSGKNGDDNSSKKKKRMSIAQTETKTICGLRFIINFALIGSALLCSLTVYLYLRWDQRTAFRTQFKLNADRIIANVHSEIFLNKLNALDTLSASITSFRHVVPGTRFPNVTIPDFEVRGSNIRTLTDDVSIYWCPLVFESQRKGWEAYALKNYNRIMSAYMAELQLRDGQDAKLNIFKDKSTITKNQFFEAFGQKHYHPLIFGNSGEPVPKNSGPYLPLWQMSPALPIKSLLNYNMLVNAQFTDALWTTLNNSQPVMSKVHNYPSNTNQMLEDSDQSTQQFLLHNTLQANLLETYLTLGQYRHENNISDLITVTDPASTLIYPVFSNFAHHKKYVAGVLLSDIHWRLHLLDVLPPEAVGYYVVLSVRPFNQTFTFRIDGENATFVGIGDGHDTKYNEYAISQNLMDHYSTFIDTRNQPYTGMDLDMEYCTYTLTIYPSADVWATYIGWQPTVFFWLIISVFVFTASTFFLYDWLVERRNKILHDRAAKTGEIVSSLFPENVRSRLFEENDISHSDSPVKKTGIKWFDQHSPTGNQGGAGSTDEKRGLNPKRLSKDNANYLRNSFQQYVDTTNSHADLGGLGLVQANKPIADLFPATTILFADLAGFTSWSSKRQPEEVFILLETLYRAFDKVADKRDVFKVETIGDCYVAVTGIPYPQGDHAARMCKFARDCMHKMRYLIHNKLTRTLGEDTAKLNFRVGMHSGPVTAGVLRGQKSRFQLFGDTMNTASRMESNGIPGKIHVSPATKDELVKNGYEQWLVKREDKINPKGKGEMQTYFVNVRRSAGSVASAQEIASDHLMQELMDNEQNLDGMNEGDDDELHNSAHMKYSSMRHLGEGDMLELSNHSDSMDNEDDEEDNDNKKILRASTRATRPSSHVDPMDMVNEEDEEVTDRSEPQNGKKESGSDSFHSELEEEEPSTTSLVYEAYKKESKTKNSSSSSKDKSKEQNGSNRSSNSAGDEKELAPQNQKFEIFDSGSGVQYFDVDEEQLRTMPEVKDNEPKQMNGQQQESAPLIDKRNCNGDVEEFHDEHEQVKNPVKKKPSTRVVKKKRVRKVVKKKRPTNGSNGSMKENHNYDKALNSGKAKKTNNKGSPEERQSTVSITNMDMLYEIV